MSAKCIANINAANENPGTFCRFDSKKFRESVLNDVTLYSQGIRHFPHNRLYSSRTRRLGQTPTRELLRRIKKCAAQNVNAIRSHGCISAGCDMETRILIYARFARTAAEIKRRSHVAACRPLFTFLTRSFRGAANGRNAHT